MFFEDKFIANLNEYIELDLGELLVNQLEEKFKDDTLMYPQGFKAMVQVPTSFAKQLFAFYIESIYEQMEANCGNSKMENLMAEDEEYAESLNEYEIEDLTLEEIQHTSTTSATKKKKQRKKKKQVKKWKDITPDQLAIEMAQDKLVESFPSIQKLLLINVLKAHNNNYEETANLLINDSFNNNNNIINPTAILKPPLDEELLDEIQYDFITYKDEMVKKRCSGKGYRKEADEYLEIRKNLYKKANKFKQKGLIKVARFYSNLATKQTLHYERASERAVSAFVKASPKRFSNNTLNLHFLRLKEAQTYVDIFLDEHINSIRESSSTTKCELQIITGRGRHSPEGKPVLRPAIINHLKKRGLKFVMLNEGMLKISIRKDSKLTNE